MKTLFKIFSIFLIAHCSLFIVHCNAQWQQTNGPYGGSANCLVLKGDTILAGTGYSGGGGGVFFSTDNGESWISMGLTNYDVNALSINKNNIYVGTLGSGIFLSTNNGAGWSAMNNGMTNSQVNSIAISGNNIFAGTNAGVFLSIDNGASWNNVGLDTDYVYALAISGNNIFAGIGNKGRGVFLSSNNGASWDAVNNGLPYDYVYSLVISGDSIFAGSGGVYLSTNNGASWDSLVMTADYVYSLAKSGKNIIAGTGYSLFDGDEGGIYLSTDNGASWRAPSWYRYGNGLPYPNWKYFENRIFSLLIIDNHIFAGTYGGVFISTNNGAYWTGVNNGLIDTWITFLTMYGANIFTGIDNYNFNGVYLSSNNGASWYASPLNDNETVSSIAVSGNHIFAGTYGGVILSTDNGVSWNYVFGAGVKSGANILAIKDTNIFVETWGYRPTGAHFSTNNGANWMSLNISAQCLAITGINIFAGVYREGVFLTTNNGASWAAVNKGLNDSTDVITLAINGANIFAGTDGGVYLSTNNGGSWTAINKGLTDSTHIQTLTISGTNIFAGTNGGGVYLSTNNGASWAAINNGLLNTYIQCLTIRSDTIYAGTGGAGVWKRPLSEMLGINELSTINNQLSTKIYPNPINQLSTINYKLSTKSLVNIKVYDFTGREISTLINSTQDKGNYKIPLNPNNYKSGIYFIKLQTNNNINLTKFIKD